MSSTSVTSDPGTGNLIFTGRGFSSPDNSSIRFTDDGSFTPGTDTPPTTGSTAYVPGGSAANPIPYRSKDLLQLSGVSLNGGAIPVLFANAVHLVAYVGDVDGNGSYSSNDAVEITRVALQTDSGLTAYVLVDPVILADTDGSDFIPADAALQVNEAGVGALAWSLPFPAIPGGVHFQITLLPWN